MTIREAIQRVSSLYNKGVQSDDTALKRRHIYSVLNTVRLQFINEYLQRGLAVPEDYSVVLDFQLIEEHNISDNSLYSLSDCGLMRTQCEIPSPYYFNKEPFIIYVSSVDGTIRLSKTDFLNKKYLSFSKYAGKFPHFFWKDNYIFTINTKLQKYIRIRYIPNNVVQVYTNICLYNDCVVYDDIVFPVPDSDIEKVIEIAAGNLINTMLSVPQDMSNDSSDIRQTVKT